MWSRSLRAPKWTILTLATLASFAPALGIVFSTAAADALGCQLDEGGTHPCVVLGIDIGDELYELFVLGWLILITWPVMILCAMLWIALGILACVSRVRSRRAARRD